MLPDRVDDHARHNRRMANSRMVPRLQAVCFDLMGTVLYDPYREALEAAIGLDVLRGPVRRDPTCWPDFEMAKIDEAEFAARFFEDGDHRFDLDAFHRARREGYRYLPGMAELIEALHGRVARYVASNYPVWIEELSGRFGFAALFEGVYASCHFGVRKPDATFYERLLECIGHEPGACLFVDDREVNCSAAERAGMRAHLFTDATDFAARLRAEGVVMPAG